MIISLPRTVILAAFCLIGLAPRGQSAETDLRERPDFGVILNEDGDLAFVSEDPAESKRLLEAAVDGHATAGIHTYVFCIGSGSDTLNYPTEAGSALGWRTTKYEDSHENWAIRTRKARAAIDAGLDAVRIAGERAKQNGMLFIPSLRMNDSHFMSDPENYPLTGEFWMKRGQELKIGDSPLTWRASYGELLNFEHEEVREYRLGVIREVIERNKDIIDGFELDFNRMQVLFPEGKAEEGAPLITELVRTVRQQLDAVAREVNRPMYLFVRVPPSDEACKWAGLEVDRWITEDLVDLVSPAQLMTLAHDMPIQSMTKLANEHGVKMYPSLYPRTGFRVPLIPSDSTLGMNGAVNRSATIAETLAAAANYRNQGADGLYLFNYYAPEAGRRPYPDSMFALVALLNRGQADAGDKVYAVTKTYFNDDKIPSYAYPKQLPKLIDGSETFTIEVGEIPGDSPFPLKTCVIRVGIKGNLETAPELKLNGKSLTHLKAVEHPDTYRGRPAPRDSAGQSHIYLIDDPTTISRGANTVSVEMSGELTDLELGFSYFNQLSRLLFGQETALNQFDILRESETFLPPE